MASTAVKDKLWYTKIREVKKNNAKNVANWYKDGNVTPNPYLFKSLDKDERETIRVLTEELAKTCPDKQIQMVDEITKHITTFGKVSGPVAIAFLYINYIKIGECTLTITWDLIKKTYPELDDFEKWESILVNDLDMFGYKNDGYILLLFLTKLIEYSELPRDALTFSPPGWKNPYDIEYNVETCMSEVLLGAIQKDPSVSKFAAILKIYPSLYLYKQNKNTGLWNTRIDLVGSDFVSIQSSVLDTIVNYILNSGEFADKQAQLEFIENLFTAMVSIKSSVDFDVLNHTDFYDSMDLFDVFQSFKFRDDFPEAGELRAAYTYNQLEAICTCIKQNKAFTGKYSQIMELYRTSKGKPDLFENTILAGGCSIPASVPNPAPVVIPATPVAAAPAAPAAAAGPAAPAPLGPAGPAAPAAPSFTKTTIPEVIQKLIARNLGPLAYTNIHDLVKDKLLQDESITSANAPALINKSKITELVAWSKANEEKLKLYKKALDELTPTNTADSHTRSTLIYITKNMLEKDPALQGRAAELAKAVIDSLMVVKGSSDLAIDLKVELIDHLENIPDEIDPWITTNLDTLKSFIDLLTTNYPLQKPLAPIKIPPPPTPVLTPFSPPSFEPPLPPKSTSEMEEITQFATTVPILKAIVDKDKTQFDALDGTDPFDKDDKQRGLMFYAAIANFVDIFDDLHSNNPDAYKEKDNYGKTILMYAAEAGSLDVIDWILTTDSGIQEVINEKTNAGRNALWYATKGCHIEAIRKLKDYYDIQYILAELQTNNLTLNDERFEADVLKELGSNKSRIENLEGGRRKKQTRRARYRTTRRTRHSRKY